MKVIDNNGGALLAYAYRKMLAIVSSYDTRRGVAVVVTESGRRVRVFWELLRGLPILASGQKMVVGFDGEGEIKSLKLAREARGVTPHLG
jgi:hypothetical protein